MNTDVLKGFGLENIGEGFTRTVEDIIEGRFSLSPQDIVNAGIRLLIGDVLDNRMLMGRLIAIALITALLTALMQSMKPGGEKSVGEVAFYVGYILLIMLLVDSFRGMVVTMSALLKTLTNMMLAAAPIMVGLLIFSGKTGAGTMFQPLFMFFTEFIAILITRVSVPMITTAAVISAVNYIEERDVLTKLAELLKKLVKWSLSISAFLFVSILSLNRITSPILDNLAFKAAKASAGAVPMVGGILGGALDMTIFWSQSIKSGVMAALAIVIAVACAVPVLKILAIVGIYKFTAAIIQPVADPRLVKCIDAVASFIALLLYCVMTVALMFISAVITVATY